MLKIESELIVRRVLIQFIKELYSLGGFRLGERSSNKGKGGKLKFIAQKGKKGKVCFF